MKQKRYLIGGYEGDQLQPLVDALIRDAEEHPLGCEPLREVVAALHARLCHLQATAGSETGCSHSWVTDWKRHERVGRVCAWCEKREPDPGVSSTPRGEREGSKI